MSQTNVLSEIKCFRCSLSSKLCAFEAKRLYISLWSESYVLVDVRFDFDVFDQTFGI